MIPSLCGRSTDDQMAASPFERIVSFGYEDGPVSGIVRCNGCDDSYLFEVVATDIDGVYNAASWDQGEELRVFALTPLPAGTFDRIVALLAAVEAPSWPIWVPGAKARSTKIDQLLANDVAAIVSGLDQWQHVVVASGLLQPFVAVRDVPPENDPVALDWFAWFGFAAKEQLVARS